MDKNRGEKIYIKNKEIRDFPRRGILVYDLQAVHNLQLFWPFCFSLSSIYTKYFGQIYKLKDTAFTFFKA